MALKSETKDNSTLYTVCLPLPVSLFLCIYVYIHKAKTFKTTLNVNYPNLLPKMGKTVLLL